MKFRKDFVTNSSSSSFTCEICGNTESGWDLSLDEADMCECENGHVICKEHMLAPTREQLIEELLKYDKWDETKNCGVPAYTPDEIAAMTDEEMMDAILEEYDEIPECMCPICQFDEYSEYDMAAYLYSQYHVPKDEVFQKIKEQNKRRKKLYDSEYITYVVAKFGLDLGKIQASWKEQYKTYKEFSESLERF